MTINAWRSGDDWLYDRLAWLKNNGSLRPHFSKIVRQNNARSEYLSKRNITVKQGLDSHLVR